MPSAAKINVTLPEDMVREVRAAVENGEFASASEALRDAVRLWQRQRLEDAERLATLRERVQRSLADPRPDLSEAEVERHFAKLHAETVKAHRGAKA